MEFITQFATSQCHHQAEDRIVAVHRPWPQRGQRTGGPTDVHHLIHDTAEELQGTAAGSYHLLALFDGHRRATAASFCAGALVGVLESHLPSFHQPAASQPATGPAQHPAAAATATSEAEEWEGHLQAALLRTVVELQQQLGSTGCGGGCTAAIVLQVGRLLTCASIGNVRAAVFCSSSSSSNGGSGSSNFVKKLELSADHRLGSNQKERERLAQAGVQVAAMDVGGTGPAPVPSRGCGPLRLWPGGLTVSRALGDFCKGEALLPLPHLRQALLPPEGGRLVIASESVWKAGVPYACRVRDILATSPVLECPSQVAQTVSKEFGVRGDVSVIVADVAPAGAAEAACAARPAPEKACQQGRGKQGERGGCGFLGRLFSGAKCPVAARPVAPAPAPAESTPSGTCQLLFDADSAHLMGLTAEPPPDALPAWLDLRLMSDLHRSMKRARQSWQALRRARAAAAEIQALQAQHAQRGQHGGAFARSRSSSRLSGASTPTGNDEPAEPADRDGVQRQPPPLGGVHSSQHAPGGSLLDRGQGGNGGANRDSIRVVSTAVSRVGSRSGSEEDEEEEQGAGRGNPNRQKGMGWLVAYESRASKFTRSSAGSGRRTRRRSRSHSPPAAGGSSSPAGASPPRGEQQPRLSPLPARGLASQASDAKHWAEPAGSSSASGLSLLKQSPRRLLRSVTEGSGLAGRLGQLRKAAALGGTAAGLATTSLPVKPKGTPPLLPKLFLPEAEASPRTRGLASSASDSLPSVPHGTPPQPVQRQRLSMVGVMGSPAIEGSSPPGGAAEHSLAPGPVSISRPLQRAPWGSGPLSRSSSTNSMGHAGSKGGSEVDEAALESAQRSPTLQLFYRNAEARKGQSVGSVGGGSFALAASSVAGSEAGEQKRSGSGRAEEERGSGFGAVAKSGVSRDTAEGQLAPHKLRRSVSFNLPVA